MMYDELIKRLRAQADAERYFVGESMLYDVAADAIEELQGELQALKDDTDMAIVEDGKTTKLCFTKKWIPVTERLPGIGKDVLCFCRANICLVLSRDGNLWREGADHYYMSGFVTHWMPLPQPPETKN